MIEMVEEKTFESSACKGRKILYIKTGDLCIYICDEVGNTLDVCGAEETVAEAKKRAAQVLMKKGYEVEY